MNRTASLDRFSVRIDAGWTSSAVAPPTQQGNLIVKLHGARVVQIFSTTIERARGQSHLDDAREVHGVSPIEVSSEQSVSQAFSRNVPFPHESPLLPPHTGSEAMNFSFKPKQRTRPTDSGTGFVCLGGPYFEGARTSVVLRLLAVRLFGGAQLGAGGGSGFANFASLHLFLVLRAAEIAVRFG